MNETILALTGYISWILILLVCLAIYRTTLMILEKRPDLTFKQDGSDVPALGARLLRAQANTVESFSFIGGTMLLALATNSSVITDQLALLLLAARLGQSIVHIASTSNNAIRIRFILFLIQAGICAYWITLLIYKFI